MLGNAVRRRSLVAMAGAAAGAATVAVAPTGASAQAAADSQPEFVIEELPAGALPQPTTPAPDSHGICNGVSQFRGSSTGLLYRLPTTSNGSGQTHCVLSEGNNTPGVGKLQDALNRCNLRENLATDNQYGSLTTAAVKRAQDHYGITADGVYGPVTRNNLFWPGFTDGGSHLACTRLGFNP